MRLISRALCALAIVGSLALLYFQANRYSSDHLIFRHSDDDNKHKPYAYPHREPFDAEKIDIKQVGLSKNDPQVLEQDLTAEELIKHKQAQDLAALYQQQQELEQAGPQYKELQDLFEAANRLEKAPLLSYEASLKLNNATCPLSGYNYDRASLHANYQRWASYTDKEIAAFRKSLVKGMRDMAGQTDQMPEALLAYRWTEAQRSQKLIGRGLVFSAGDADALRRVLLNIKILREHGCTLPAEVFSHPWEAESLPQDIKDELLGLNVLLRAVTGGLEKSDEWKDFRIKPLAILQSSFEHVLWLDSDSFALRDPTHLFDSAHYRDYGLLLWPDFTKSQPRNVIWRILGFACRPEHEGESGQILIDKNAHRATLQLATWFATTNADDQKLWYSHFGGDRDSFRISAVILGLPFRGPKRLVSVAGQEVLSQPLASAILPDDDDKSGELMPADVKESFVIQSSMRDLHAAGHTMLQYDFDGQPLFVHANLIKHRTLPRDQRIWSVITRLKDDRIPGGSYGSFAQEPPSTTTETFEETVARGGYISDEERQREQEAMYAKALNNKNAQKERGTEKSKREPAELVDGKHSLIVPMHDKHDVSDLLQANIEFGRGIIVHVAQSPLGTMMLDLHKVLQADETVQVGTEKADGSSPFVIEHVKEEDALWKFEDLYLRFGGTT
jgi:alpha 1,2-mannosyltransferase